MGAEPFDVPVYQIGLEELREQVVQQDKHSHLLQNILGQMVSVAKRLEASTQPLALACRVGDSMALGVLARFGVPVPTAGAAQALPATAGLISLLVTGGGEAAAELLPLADRSAVLALQAACW